MVMQHTMQHSEHKTSVRHKQANVADPHTIQPASNNKQCEHVDRANVELGVPRLQLNLLGTPEIVIDGAPARNIERCSRSALVLYMLALHRRGLSGESLALELSRASPDLDEFECTGSMSVDALRMLVFRLRKLSAWRGIVTCYAEQSGYQNRYRLADDTVCDVWEFEEKLGEAAALSVRANMEQSSTDLAAMSRQQAIMLYRGEFCKGIGLAPIVQGAFHLHKRYLQALLVQANYWKNRAMNMRQDRLGHGLAEGSRMMSPFQTVPVPHTASIPDRGNSEYYSAAKWISEERAWLESASNYRLAAQAEPFEEAAYVGVMICQAYLGQREGVRKTLDECSRVFQAELGRAPHPATMQLANRCLDFASGVAGPWGEP